MRPSSACRPILLAAGLVAAIPSQAGAAGGVFASFAGAWSGLGTVTMANGDTRSISCRSTYLVGGAAGTTMSQVLDCTSAGAALQLSASYVYAAGAISGSWSEAVRGVHGALTGHAKAGHIQATVAAVGFVGGLGLDTRGRKQSMTFQAQGAADVRRVAISMRKV